ncbi:hypothetical protein DFH07DRAFT_1054517 [Mycena maculata]|uniref:Uncharacterized protein n=1 Tax=Mycena maculata TaxID=230809 RepID=A0AAD7KGE2_9AGAR|nr:hypothetical protein DFH07DRAFT_1054517 [Mycena maculata]
MRGWSLSLFHFSLPHDGWPVDSLWLVQSALLVRPMILPCLVLVVLSLCFADVTFAAPLSSTSASSSASPSPSSNLTYDGGPLPSIAALTIEATSHLPAILPPTIAQQLNTTLTQLSPGGALDRWVTAAPISGTSLGSDNVIQSNADLASFVDVAFMDDPAQPGNGGWVDTYIQFLIEAGSTNVTEIQETALTTNLTNSTTALAAAQVKLVTAYEDANPNNVTYVGVNIWNVSRIDPLSLGVIEEWGAQGNGNYTKDDYADYTKLNATLAAVKAQVLELSEELQLAIQGNQFKINLGSYPLIFNQSMIVGGQASSSLEMLDPTDVRIAPAWGASITNNSIIPPSSVQDLPANLTTNATSASVLPSTSTSPSQSSSALNSHPVSSGPIPTSTHASSSTSPQASSSTPAHASSSNSAHAARSTAPPKQRRAISAVNAVAKSNGTVTTPIKPIRHSVSGNGTTTPSSSASGAMPSGTDPLGNIPGTLKGNLMMFSITPGSWADDLASNVAFVAKERPDVFAKYFGNGTSGMGPIGRVWTHVCVITTDDPDTPGLNTVQVLGRVWDVLPALKGLS